MHIWMPVLAVVALTKVVAQVFPHARYYPAGAWSLYLGVVLVYTGDRLAERGRVPRVLQAPRSPTWVIAARLVRCARCTITVKHMCGKL